VNAIYLFIKVDYCAAQTS